MPEAASRWAQLSRVALRRGSSVSDVAVAVAVAALDTLLFSRISEDRSVTTWTAFHPPTLVIVLVGAVAVPLLAVRRRAPVPACLGVSMHAAAGCLTIGSRPLVGLLVVLFTVATLTPRRTALWCLVPIGAAQLIEVGYDSLLVRPTLSLALTLATLAVNVLLAAVAFGAGRWRRASRQEVEGLHRARAEMVQQAVTDERLRIARELHDIVAHAVTVMVLQAAGARSVLDRDPDAARTAMGNVESLGKQAVSELRRLLAVLRSVSAVNLDEEQAPGLWALDALVTRARDTGLTVGMRTTGDQAHLDPSVELAAYRAVQEGLTNVVRHAGEGTTVDVLLCWREDALVLEISDNGAGVRSPAVGDLSIGTGLIGLRERISLIGGTLQAGPRPAGGYLLTARLPVELATRDGGGYAATASRDGRLPRERRVGGVSPVRDSPAVEEWRAAGPGRSGGHRRDGSHGGAPGVGPW
jgi:signal transduction histidine kinase